MMHEHEPDRSSPVVQEGVESETAWKEQVTDLLAGFGKKDDVTITGQTPATHPPPTPEVIITSATVPPR